MLSLLIMRVNSELSHILICSVITSIHHQYICGLLLFL